MRLFLDAIQVGEHQGDLTIGPSLRPVSEEEYGRPARVAQGEQRAEVSIGRDHCPLLLGGASEDLLVRRSRKPVVANMHGVVARDLKLLRYDRRERVVDEEPQPAGTSGSSRSRTAAAAYSSASRMSSASRSG